MAVDDEHCFVGFDAYQKVIDSGVDVVVLGTPPAFRPEQLKACVDAGKHVFCEKPVAVDAPGIRSVLESSHKAKEKNLSIVSGLCWRYHDGVKMHAYCRQQSGCWPDVSDQYIGTKGTVSVLSHAIEGENKWRFKGSPRNMYEFEHKVLFNAIRSGKPKNDGHYMSISSMLAILGRMVGYTGNRITWEQAMNSTQKLGLDKYSMDTNPPVMPNKDAKYDIAMPGITQFK